MAIFTLAGKIDCPHFAKAELLADTLQRRLPDFRVHKISVLPEDWEEWLKATCERNGFKHEHSPLVWRDLVVQGGKAMLLGGFSDFLEHCQEYYGVTSDMPSELMLSVAAENLQAKRNQMAEEQLRVSLIQPLHIWISGALSPTSHTLIPGLLSAETFPGVSEISLHLLDLEGTEAELHTLKMDTQDLALSMLHQITIHTNLEGAFTDADIILLLDDRAADGEGDRSVGGTVKEEGNREEGEAAGKDGIEEDGRSKVRKILERYREYGQLIDSGAHKEVKVIVSGGSFVNLRCSLLVDGAKSIGSQQFIAMATQLENEAKAILAKQLKVKTSDVTDVIVWGNISGIFHIDLQMAKVFNYDGPIIGPPFFFQPLLKVLPDRKWVETDLQHLAGRQRGAVTAKTGRAVGMAAAHSILTILRAWNGVRDSPEVLSAGVQCTGHYNIPEGVVLSVPVVFREGNFSVLTDLSVTDKLEKKLQLSIKELLQEKELAEERN